MITGNNVTRWQLRAALLTLILILATQPVFAEREWISLDGSQEGTEAELSLDEGQSTPQHTWLKLTLHGFYIEEKQSPQGDRYHQVTVPGMGSINQAGAPDLPAMKGRLGIGTTAQQINYVETELVSTQTFDSFFDVWPQVYGETEPVEGNLPERFVINEDLYATDREYPVSNFTFDQAFTNLHGLPTSDFDLTPFQWNPVSGVLKVVDTMHVLVDHPGELLSLGPYTRDMFQYMSNVLINMEEIDDLMLLSWWHYDADYLIVGPSDYMDTLDDFIALKRSQGYFVSKRTVEEIGGSCNLIRAAIADWYDDAPTSRDKYCLLVGDVDVIPNCQSPYLNEDYPVGVATDDLYGSVNGDDLDEEVYVGRLSVDSEGDLEQQLDRIIAYQTGGHLLQDFSKVALVAHRENAPGKYTAAHESVRLASYSLPPIFETYYGYLGATDADVSNGINEAFGLVAYRGHGSSSAWTSWNTSNGYYNDADISNLTNTVHPVVWSFSCTNSRLGSEDCVAEEWMEKGSHGAISHYGSTVASYTSINHELDRQMFQAVYDEGLTIQGQAIQYGEEMTGILSSPTNSWMYLLLGDPSMRIRTHGSLSFGFTLPEVIYLDPDNPFELVLDIHDAGDPLADVLFAIWKPGDDRELVDEVFDNTYSDESGRALLSILPESEGWLYFTLRDAHGWAVYDSIEVRTDPTSLPDLETAVFHFWAEPSVVRDQSVLRLSRGLGSEVEIEIFDVTGRRVRGILLDSGQESGVWDCNDSRGRRVSGGVYFARIKEGGRQHSTRLTVLN